MLTLQEKKLTVYHNTVVQTPDYYYDDFRGFEADGPSDTVIGMTYEEFQHHPNQHTSIIMDELAMWNSTLSEAEVDQIYDISFQ